MALVQGINSYVDLSEAEAYFENRLDVAAWTEASEVQKAQALVTATQYLDELHWLGTAVSESQNLAFPRIGEYFDPKYGMLMQLENNVPERIKKATNELAYHLLNNDGLLDDSGAIKDLAIGSIRLGSLRNSNKLPNIVRMIVKPLLSNNSRTWWRNN